jgi:hypothetical protein
MSVEPVEDVEEGLGACRRRSQAPASSASLHDHLLNVHRCSRADTRYQRAHRARVQARAAGVNGGPGQIALHGLWNVGGTLGIAVIPRLRANASSFSSVEEIDID